MLELITGVVVAIVALLVVLQPLLGPDIRVADFPSPQYATAIPDPPHKWIQREAVDRLLCILSGSRKYHVNVLAISAVNPRLRRGLETRGLSAGGTGRHGDTATEMLPLLAPDYRYAVTVSLHIDGGRVDISVQRLELRYPHVRGICGNR